MSLNTAAVTAGIAALSITGVTIKDMDEIPEVIEERDCPIMFPEPAGMVGDYSSEPLTFGTTGAFWSPTRTIIYTYLHAMVGTERRLSDFFLPMTIVQDSMFEKLVEMDITDIDMVDVRFSRMGTLENTTGMQAYGFTVDVVVREKVNA